MDRDEQEKLKIRKYRNCFTDIDGQFVLDDLEKHCLFRSRNIFVVDSQRKTDFNLGANEVILYIHGLLDKKIEEPKQDAAIHKELPI